MPFWGIRVSDWCCGLSLSGGGLESRASIDESRERERGERDRVRGLKKKIGL